MYLKVGKSHLLNHLFICVNISWLFPTWGYLNQIGINIHYAPSLFDIGSYFVAKIRLKLTTQPKLALVCPDSVYKCWDYL